jgi:biotin transport system substrate-specific component
MTSLLIRPVVDRPLVTVERPLSAGLAVLAGSLLIALSSWISVPMIPVPMTMQTFAVLLVAAVLGPRLGTASVLLYLAEGAAGLPVFAGGTAGYGRLLGPTGGFLLAFPIAAYATGWLMQRAPGRSLLGALAVMLIGHALIFAGGVPWLALTIGIERALTLGFMPFIPGTLVKSALIVASLAALRRGLRSV